MKNKKNTDHKKKADTRPLPGDYPPREDAMLNMSRVDIDPDNLDTTQKGATRGDIYPGTTRGAERNESDLTREDYEALGPRDLSLDGGDDEELKHRTRPVDFAGRDLDIPGSELDDNSEALGSEDEENNGYSLGSDANSNLEDGGRP